MGKEEIGEEEEGQSHTKWSNMMSWLVSMWSKFVWAISTK